MGYTSQVDYGLGMLDGIEEMIFWMVSYMVAFILLLNFAQ